MGIDEERQMGRQKMEQAVDEIRAQAEEAYLRTKRRLEPMDRWIRENVAQRPVLFLLGAVGVGYLIGRVLRG